MQYTSLAEQLLMTTIRIDCVYSDGRRGMGTGFLMSLFTEPNGNIFPILITNKHVIRNAVKGMLVLPFKIGSLGPELKGRYILQIEEFETAWVDHPDDKVDLCALPFANLYQLLIDEKKYPYLKWLDAKHIPSQEEFRKFTPIEDILMIGYPIGLWDAQNNLPIVRRGITATPLAVNYNGKKEFMIDAACFPGSSGSPVLLRSTPHSISDGVIIEDKPVLLGILYAGPIHNANGTIEVIEIPTSTVAIATTGIPVNLGYVIKSYQILEFEPIFRDQLEKNKMSQAILKNATLED